MAKKQELTLKVGIIGTDLKIGKIGMLDTLKMIINFRKWIIVTFFPCVYVDKGRNTKVCAI